MNEWPSVFSPLGPESLDLMRSRPLPWRGSPSLSLIIRDTVLHLMHDSTFAFFTPKVLQRLTGEALVVITLVLFSLLL